MKTKPGGELDEMFILALQNSRIFIQASQSSPITRSGSQGDVNAEE
jgi:hypothetical protein